MKRRCLAGESYKTRAGDQKVNCPPCSTRASVRFEFRQITIPRKRYYKERKGRRNSVSVAQRKVTCEFTELLPERGRGAAEGGEKEASRIIFFLSQINEMRDPEAEKQCILIFQQ